MRIKIIAVGQKMPSWVNSGYQEYAKRLGTDITLQLVEIPAGKRSKNADIGKLIAREGKLSLASVGKNDCIIAMDVLGKHLSTEAMAQQLATFQQEGHNISLLVGGPEGLAPACLEAARLKWSLSALTLPHPLVRILLAEQIYRCWALLKGHPYHK